MKTLFVFLTMFVSSAQASDVACRMIVTVKDVVTVNTRDIASNTNVVVKGTVKVIRTKAVAGKAAPEPPECANWKGQEKQAEYILVNQDDLALAEVGSEMLATYSPDDPDLQQSKWTLSLIYVSNSLGSDQKPSPL